MSVPERCPHPYGSELYYLWHEMKQRPLVAAIENLDAMRRRREHLERIKFGHVFDNDERRCRCGMTRLDYLDQVIKTVCPKGEATCR